MDGRGPGICVISLGRENIAHGINIDTEFWFQFEDILSLTASLVCTNEVCKILSVMQSLAQCDKNYTE